MSDIPPNLRSCRTESTESSEGCDQIDFLIKKGDALDGPTVEENDTSDDSDKDLQDFIYPMKKAGNGYCGLMVIFNQKKFARLAERLGTEKDCAALESLWADLGFDVRIHEDKTLDEIRKKISDYAEKTDYSKYNCFACTIMSHGRERDYVYAKDQKYQLDKEIVEPFRDCPTLIGKPKLFFVQACRGTDLDHGKNLGSDVPDADPDKTEVKIPREADFLIAYSTVEGYYSWRDKYSGSWFIQTLVKCIRNHHDKLDLLQLLTLVNKNVGKRESDTEEEEFKGKKQSPSIVSRLTRLLYFGCEEDKGKIEFKRLHCEVPFLNGDVSDSKDSNLDEVKRAYYEMKVETSLKKKELAEMEERMYRMRLRCRF